MPVCGVDHRPLWCRTEFTELLGELIARYSLVVFARAASSTYAVITGETDLLDDRLGNLLDRDFLILADAENDGADLVILAKRPDEELGEIPRVDELTQWATGAGDVEGRGVLCCSGMGISGRLDTLCGQLCPHAWPSSTCE